MSDPITHFTPDWPAPRNVRTAQTLRTGGVSSGDFQSLNVGAHVGDDPRAVEENRKRVHAALHLPAEPVWLSQVHGAEVVDADQATARQGDGIVARGAGIVCVIQTADCMPVLLTDGEGTVVAAAHAGWRGLAAGVLETTVAAMGVPPTQIIAWLGPAISQPAFEVGSEVREAFAARDPEAADCFERNARGRWQADLYALARRRLAALGIARISGGGLCTFTDRARFFSHRRDGRSGRMATLIWREDRGPMLRSGQES